MKEKWGTLQKQSSCKWIVILCILMMGLLLFGCSKETNQRTNQIPSDGIIQQKVFENIKDTGDIGIFNGNHNNITYQWLFFGNLIEQPKDENLLITFSNAKTKEIKDQLGKEYVQEFSFVSNQKVSGNPSLSVYLSAPWDAANVEIYQYEESSDSVKLISAAAVENSPNAIITFTPKEYKGLFYIVGGTEESSAEATANPEDTTNSEVNSNSETATTTETAKPNKQNTNQKQDEYLSAGGNKSKNNSKGDSSKSSAPKANQQDEYLTDPVPEGKPKPVEPENATIDKGKQYTATLSIRSDTILNNLDKFNPDKLSVLPKDGVIMQTRTVVFNEGESVFDVLKRETRASKIHMEMEFYPIYNSAYIEGINNIYEFDCGELSGWMYKVNGWFPNYGSSRYLLKNGDVIEWVYTCDLGRDVGGYVEGVEN
ncbi:DUF4430 domain-containing protein [Bacillus sp. REN16]|uniref:DUF4430 domain-containing protein n=1 Tax=Bacillus sp. REN16 TaxID=2887296 RepID=UPI001E3F8B4F|nr:DUF4430 domain-containing protein [Bacillus sp. REN16]MCC3359435.1 DUF4430 domain-containing protein [Bacillus sp. REN16]